uniref:Retrotransposon gag domain-containing protein n=1 Tax=Vitis vinifera TaxID=29760 RepID=A5BJD1_VITVI|nr:hypothetical protein VITISV_020845 [Vitis vinifera]
MPLASLPAKFRMPDIERTWDDLTQEFFWQFSFNTVVDGSMRKLEALRQRSDESVSFFISYWHGKIVEIVDRLSEGDQIQMVLRSLQPKIARHVVETVFLKDYGQILPLLMLKGINHSDDIDQLMPRASHQTYDQVYLPPTLALPYYVVQMSFVLILDVEEVQTPYVDVSQTFDVQNILCGDRVLRQPPPTVVRPLEGISTPEEARKEDDEILRQFQSTQARISIWSLLASSSTHKDALIQALSQIRVETTTTPEGLIHMVTVGLEPLA